MNDFKKYKIKQWIKSKKSFFIGSGIFILCGIIAWVVGCYASGANIVAWLTGSFAITIYILIGIDILTILVILFIIFMSKEGK